MKRDGSKLSFGSFVTIILTAIITSACFLILPKLFDLNLFSTENKDAVPIENTTDVFEKANSLVLPTGEPSKANVVTLNLLFSGVIRFDDKIQASLEQSSGGLQSANLFNRIKPQFDGYFTTTTNTNTYLATEAFNDLNAPPSLLLGLKDSGFNLVGFGGRNLLNLGFAGINSIVSESEKIGLNTMGINTLQNELPVFTTEIQGVKVAFLQFSQSISRAGSYAINEEETDRFIGVLTRERLERDIAKAKANGAKIIVVNMLWNEDADIRVNDYQKKVAHLIADSGADLIIGNSLTAPQNFEVLTAFDDNGNKHSVPMVYSLGGLIHSDRSRIEKVCSVLMKVNINYDVENNKVVDMTFSPTPLFLVEKELDDGTMQYYPIEAFDGNTSELTNKQLENMHKATQFLNKLYEQLPLTIQPR